MESNSNNFGEKNFSSKDIDRFSENINDKEKGSPEPTSGGEGETENTFFEANGSAFRSGHGRSDRSPIDPDSIIRVSNDHGEPHNIYLTEYSEDFSNTYYNEGNVP